MESSAPAPLANLRVLEFAGLAPVPFAGVFLADYGASVLRIDRPSASGSSKPVPTLDMMTRRKSSIVVDLASPSGIAFIKSLILHTDVLLDPYRPGVLERNGIGPEVLCKLNPRLIYARLSGYRREGPYSTVAGHDINYIALSGALSMLGRAGEAPYAPGNILGDFAGGSMMCVLGIMLAVIARQSSGRGQVVNAAMLDGAAYLASWPRMMQKTPFWDQPRGENLLDGACPWYNVYETKDGRYMAVGALEVRFYEVFIKILGVGLPSSERDDRDLWPELKSNFANQFKLKTRDEWETLFKDSDACVTPVVENSELEERGTKMRLPIGLSENKGLRIGCDDDGQGEIEEGRGMLGSF